MVLVEPCSSTLLLKPEKTLLLLIELLLGEYPGLKQQPVPHQLPYGWRSNRGVRLGLRMLRLLVASVLPFLFRHCNLHLTLDLKV